MTHTDALFVLWMARRAPRFPLSLWAGHRVSAFVQLSWAFWHRGYPDQSTRAADRALAYSRQLGHAHTLAYALGLAGRAAVFARDVATVYTRSNDCVAIASEHGFVYWVALGRILRGWADAQKDEATMGIVQLQPSMELLSQKRVICSVRTSEMAPVPTIGDDDQHT